MNTDEQIRAETDRFRKALPELLTRYAGKWVLFRDGEVAGVFEDEFEACRAGLKRWGRQALFVVERVAEPEPPVPVSAVLDYFLP